MGRKVTVGILPGGVGLLSFDQNTVSTVDLNADLRLSANGTGAIVATTSVTVTTGNVTIDNQGDLRLKEASANGSNHVAIQAASAMSADYTITLPDAVAGRNGYVLASDTSGNTSWVPAQSFAYSVQNTSFSAVAFGAYFVDTSGGAITATLPSSPQTGDTIRFFDVAKTFDSNALTVGRNGQTIQGDAADLTVNSESAAFDLVYANGTYGWRIFSI